MNDETSIQFYQGNVKKLTEFPQNLGFFTNEINSSSDNDFRLFKNGHKYKVVN